MNRFKWIGVMCALLLTSQFCYGQAVSATVLGTVTDSTGAVVANAKVTATQISTGVSRTTQTNGSGNYVFPNTTPGTYTVTVEESGFKKETRANIVVDVNTSTRVDVQLQLGDVNQAVEVTGAPPLLQTDRADTGGKIDIVQAANLPVGTNRNFQSLLNLIPGTTRASFQHSTFFNAASSLQTEVNGQMRMGNNYQIEGIDDNERTGLLQILVPPIEAIQTVDVSTSNFEAELGRASGAVTNVILKSGTNSIHGAAYEFTQNNYFNARNTFNPSVGHLTYNYFGGNVGGPIIKDKLFYFGDILDVRDHEANANLLTIPTPAQISGDLSASPTTIYNPSTGNADGTGRASFPGNRIPASMVNPISAKLMSLLPPPNNPSTAGNNNYFALLPFHKDTLSYDVKVDYVASEKDRVSVRLSYAKPEVFQAPAFGLAGGNANGAFQGTGIQRTWSGGINYDHVFSPTLIMELRAGVAYYHNEATPAGYGTPTSTQLGIPGVNLDQFTSGIIGLNIGSFYSNPLLGFSASLPWDRAEANIDIADTLTKIVGNHTIKFGGDLRRVRDGLLQEQTYSPRGVYTFSDGQTALNTAGKSSATSYYNNFASFLLDVPNQAGRDLDTYFPSYRAWQLFAFAQDKWTVTPKLTLDLGLRWEYYPSATPEHSGGFSNYDPTTNSLHIAGIGDVPKDLGIKSHYKYFAPRFGAAYRVSDRTVFRAGFGISYTPFPDNNYAYNYPVRANNVYNPAVAAYGPAVLNNGQTATFQNGFPPATLPAIPSNGIITNAPINQSYFVVGHDFKNPSVESWNISLQQALPLKLVLNLAYIGNHGVDSPVSYNLNASVVPGIGNAGLPQYAAFGRTASTTLLFAPYSSMYHALQVKLDRRFATGLSLTTAFTWGKGMAFQDGDDGGLRFYINQQRNYARNDYDRKFTFVQSYVYELPFGPGKTWLQSGLAGNIFGNWRVNGILTLMSGTPLTLTASGTSLNTPGNAQTPTQIAPVDILHGVGPNSPWFDASSFATPTARGVFGTMGRNAIDGPGFFDLDASLFKLITFKERYKLELRAEAFSVTNTPQYSNPGTSMTSVSNFGYITGASGGRTLQLGAKFSF
jgi:hypothetical protein